MADEEVEEKKSKGGLLKIILFVVGGIVLIAVGLGVGYFVFGSSQPDPSEELRLLLKKNGRSCGSRNQMITHLEESFKRNTRARKFCDHLL